MIKIEVPGKLFLIGEYSIMNPGNEAILISIDRFISVTIEESSVYELSSNYGHFKWILDNQEPVLNYTTLPHAKAAIYIAHRYLKHLGIRPSIYKIMIETELNHQDGQKYGLGSSGAVLIAVIKAILYFHGILVSKEQLFKLCVLSQLEISDLTSGGELAASIYTGWVAYKRYNPIFLFNHTGNLMDLVNQDWPGLKIQRLKITKYFPAICYSGIVQSTKDYIEKINQNDLKSIFYKAFISKAKLCVSQFKKALTANNDELVSQSISIYRQLMLDLQNWAQIQIETPTFSKMIKVANNLGITAKVSGAGYGDCGVAITTSHKQKLELNQAWEAADLMPLDLNVWEGSF